MPSNFEAESEILAFNKKEISLKNLEIVVKKKKDDNQEKIESYQTKITNKINTIEKRYLEKQEKNNLIFNKKIDKAKVKLALKLSIFDQEINNLQKDQTRNLQLLKLKVKKQFWTDDFQAKEKKYLKIYQEKSQKIAKWHQETLEDYQLNLTTFQKSLETNLEKYQNFKINKVNVVYDKKIYQNQYSIQNQSLKMKIKQENNQKTKEELIKTKKQLPFSIKENYQLVYNPITVQVNNKKTNIKSKISDYWKSSKAKFLQLKYVTIKDIIKFKLFGVPLFIYVIGLAIVLVAIYTKTMPKESMGALAILFVIAIIGGEFFNRVPIWKTFIGGGTMGVFFLAAFLGSFNVFPASIVNDVKTFFSAGGFLNLYINVLIVGSILTIPRKLIVTSFSGFMFLIFSGTVLAVSVGFGFGRIFGLSDDKTILQFMLPLLGDGNGGGVQPLAGMAESSGYMSRGDYMSFGLAVSSVSNIFVIIIAACLTAFLSKSPTNSGNGRLVKKEVIIRKDNIVPKDRHIAAALFITVIIYVFCKFLEVELKSATGVEINVFAWSVIISLLLNLSNILPKELKAGCNSLHHFFAKQFTWLIMAGVGLTLVDLKVFASLFTNWQYIFLILIMDFALVAGPFIAAKLIKFYALESMITAGCCMGAQGGTGTLAVLGASKRLELLPYSQITCRIGGGIILIIAAPIFMAFTH